MRSGTQRRHYTIFSKVNIMIIKPMMRSIGRAINPEVPRITDYINQYFKLEKRKKIVLFLSRFFKIICDLTRQTSLV